MKQKTIHILVIFFFIVQLNAADTSTSLQKQNALLALQKEKEFENFKKDDTCVPGAIGCINYDIAQCDLTGKFVIRTCENKDKKCYAFPLTNIPGISITCGKFFTV